MHSLFIVANKYYLIKLNFYLIEIKSLDLDCGKTYKFCF